jgi:ferrous-iron efflux pump FieF
MAIASIAWWFHAALLHTRAHRIVHVLVEKLSCKRAGRLDSGNASREEGGEVPMLDRERLTRLATTASVSVALSLALIKLVAAVVTGSVAVLSLLIDSVADILASTLAFVAVRIAQQPPDLKHRFGHGKAEALGALAQAALVTGSALFVLFEAVRRLYRPVEIQAGELGVAVTLISLAATGALVLFQRYVIQRTGSTAVQADRLHYTSDILANLAVLVSLVLTIHLQIFWLDALVGATIAAVLLWGVVAIGRGALAELMDRELPDLDRRRIEQIVLAHPEVQDVHDLRSRQAAGIRFIEFHIEIDGDTSVRAAHIVTDALEAELAAAFPDAEIIIHQEPAGLEDDRLDHRIGFTN